ncbi:MAG TPA: ABC transporter substrate-binding protein, partial [Hyphomicrobiaceae bacterium]|nr:ABC transporter substrate-binding protein [Hyphomicrobiaceae bacterium]
MRDCLPRSSGGDRRPATLAAQLAAALLLGSVSVAAAAEYHQAPMLEEMVKAGKLPPVEQRLPENPRVVMPVENVGKYGGTWRSGMVGGADRNWLFRIAGYEPLLAWDREWTGKVIPNLAEEVTSNQAANEFTIRLRKGLKWSDGEPFGSDDIGFFINDIVSNKELLPNAIDWMVSG